MSAGGVEQLIVASACIAFGCMVAFVPAALKSPTIEGWSPGKRGIVGYGSMLLGAFGVVLAFTS